MTVQLYKGDCLPLMDELEDNSVDMILTDPPYGITYKTNSRKDKTHDFCSEIANDETTEVMGLFLNKAPRIKKPNSACFMFASPEQMYETEELIRLSDLKVKNRIVWNKNNWTAGDLKGSYGRKWEILYLLVKGRPLIRGKRYPDVWDFDRVPPSKSVHQNQKPIPLLERAIKSFSNDGDTILDPFMGSGSTGVACVNTGRDFIGMELDDHYYEIACKRISETNKYKQEMLNIL